MIYLAFLETGENALEIFEAAFDIWNDFYKTSYDLLVQDPSVVFGGVLWSAITAIIYGLQAFGYAMLLCFLYMGLIQSITTYADLKKPVVFIRFVLRAILTKYAIDYGPTLFINILKIFIGMIQQVMISAAGFYNTNGFASYGGIAMSGRIADRIEGAGTLTGIVYCVIAILTFVVFLVLSLVIVLTVYGRIFKIMIYAAISPLPLSTFAGEPSSFVGKNFAKSYVGVCAEGVIIALCCVIFNIYVGTSGQDYLDGNTTAQCYNIVVNGSRIELTINSDFDKWASDRTGVAQDKIENLKREWKDYLTEENGNNLVYTVSDSSKRQQLITAFQACTFTQWNGGGGMKGVMLYIGRCIFMMLILCGSVKGADMLASRMFGL